MKLTGVAWTRFRLPLKAPFVAAGGPYAYREGLLLRLFSDAGVCGLGEASPHPGLGPPAVAAVEEALERIARGLLGRELQVLAAGGLFPGTGVPAALACAIETAALDLLATARGVPVAALLSASFRGWVPVNATIAVQGIAEAAAAAACARAAGCSCVKLKVGAAGGLTADRERVKAVRAAIGPGAKLRLDANGAWDYERAVSALRELREFDLELVEQPIPAGSPELMAAVRRRGGVPIAADEDVTGEDAALRLLGAGAADALVLKPMVLGGLRRALRIAGLAAAAGVSSIVTTTIDAGVGTAAALHLAAALGEGVLPCGLATGALLADDVIEPRLEVTGGTMPLPAGDGLGVSLSPAWADALGRPRIGREA